MNLAYRWFCGLSIEDKIPDHSAFSRARNERFRDSDIFRRVFERVVEACIAAGLVGGEGFAVDASLIVADANKQRSIPGTEWNKKRDPETASRAVKEYLATLDDAAFGAASDVTPKFVSPSDPAAQWTGAMRGPAFFAYADNYLIDVKFGIIMDVEASRAIRQAEVGAAKTMIERTEERFGMKPERLAADTAYGSAANARLDRQREEDRAAHSGHRQVQARGRHLLARGLHLRQGAQRLYLPGGQAADHDGHDQHRPRDALHRTRADVPSLPAQAKMLPEHARRAGSCATSTRTPATSLVRSPRPRPSSNRAATASASRCCSPTSSASSGSAGFGCAARAEPKFEFTLAAIAQNLRRLAKLVARPPPRGRCVRCVSVACVSANASKPPLPGSVAATSADNRDSLLANHVDRRLLQQNLP